MKSKWKIKKLGDIFQIERGGSPRPIESFLTTDKDGINWIKIGDTKNITKYIYTTEQKIKPSGLNKTRLVKDGDFILSNSMSFGRPYIMKTTGAIHDGWLVLRKKLEGINNDFFYYLLGSPVVFNQFDKLAAGSTVRNLNTKLVSDVEVLFPSLSEQKRIVKILDSTFEKLEKIKESIEKNLHNSKLIFDNYLSAIFIKNGKDWEESKLEDVLQKTEMVDPTKKPDEEFIYLDVSSVNKETKVIENPTVLRGKDAPSRARKLVKTNDVIFATVRPTHGRVALITKEYNNQVCSTGYFVLRTKEFLNNYLVYYFLLTHNFNKQMEKLQKGASYPAVNDSEVKDIHILFPKSISEQKSIVKKLDQLSLQTRKLQSLYKKKLQYIEELKKSILQKAFSGNL